MSNIYIRTFNSTPATGYFEVDTSAANNTTTGQNSPYASSGQFQFFYSAGTFSNDSLAIGSTVKITNSTGNVAFSSATALGTIVNVQQQTLFPALYVSGNTGGMLVWLVTVDLPSGVNFDLQNIGLNTVGNLSQGNGEMFTYNAVNVEIQEPDVDIPMYSNTINIDLISTSWIDEIYNLLYDDSNQNSPTGAQVCIDNNIGAGAFWPTDKCIDAASVYDPNGNPSLWPGGVFPNSFAMQTNDPIGSQLDGPVSQSTAPLTFNFTPITNLNQVYLQTPQDLSTIHTLEFKTDGVLKFQHLEGYELVKPQITGINIVDDMLFWTDNFSEPKKINIPRSIAGTLPDGQTHSSLVVNSDNMGSVKEEHITVIRKSPLKSPTLKMVTTLRDGTVKGPLLITSANITFSDIVGGISSFEIDNFGNNENPDFLVGDTLRLATELYGLPNDYQLRANILNINYGTNSSLYSVQTISISDSAPVNSPQTWYVALEEEGENKFERKFPRFAYRYKYIDNEYSTFSPFTNVAFKPGSFNYEPVKAYNEGMTNTVKTLVIQDFITKDIPDDVVQVDLLYKNETSPNVYLMDSIRKEDTPVLDASTNIWNSVGSSSDYNAPKGSYNVNTENIYSTLPSNQSLRSWDNVPRKALAQEVTGNRIIYGNYTQGYDIKEIENQSNQLTPDLSITVRGRGRQANRDAMPSIKSLRNYDIGVVWGDKYGRETPVITPSSGSIVVPKNKAVQSNYFTAELKNAPYWADYYRFYVKETSNEYYNLAVDRIYDAKDGNIWISFPSTDRNKVDEDTYIVLKKGADSDDLIVDEARYKILSIENNAPDYIKTVYEPLVRTNTDATRTLASCNMFNGYFTPSNNPTNCNIFPTPQTFGNFPTVNRKNFTIAYGNWTNPYTFGDTSVNPVVYPAQGLVNLKDLFLDTSILDNKLFVSFSKETVDANGNVTVITGSKYHVVGVNLHDTNYSLVNMLTWDPAGTNAQTLDYYDIKLATPILITDEFVTAGLSSVDGSPN